MKLLNARLDAAHKRLDGLSDDLKTYDEQSRARSSGHDLAIKKLERNLTSRFTGEISALDAASRKQSLANKTALRELEDNLTARFTEQMQAYETASQERSAGQDAAIQELEDSFTSKLTAQQQAFHQENANLRKSLLAVKTELDKVNERNAKTQLSLAAMASQEDLTRLIKDVRERYRNTQRVLETVSKSTAQAGRISADTRAAMERLLEAHAFFVKGGADLIAALEAEKAEGKAGTEGVYLGILYEQRAAQQRLLKDMQALLTQATDELQGESDTKDPQH